MKNVQFISCFWYGVIDYRAVSIFKENGNRCVKCKQNYGSFGSEDDKLYCNRCVSFCECGNRFVYEKDDIRVCIHTPCSVCIDSNIKCECGEYSCHSCNTLCKCVQNFTKKHVINDLAKIILDYVYVKEEWKHWY
jgi:hypothetical protein